MPASSNFREVIRDAQSSALVGPNVVNKALPYVGGGMVLTAAGTLGGLSMIASPAFMPLFWVALIGNLVLFFVAQNIALKGNNATALPLLAIYSLITGFTLSGLVAMASPGSRWGRRHCHLPADSRRCGAPPIGATAGAGLRTPRRPKPRAPVR